MPTRPNPHNLRIIGGRLARVTLAYAAALKAYDAAVRAAIATRADLDTDRGVLRTRALLHAAELALQPPGLPAGYAAAIAKRDAQPLPGILASDLKRQMEARKRASSSSSSPTPPKRGA